MSKTSEELVKEYLAKGGEIEKIPYVEPEVKNVIGSMTKKIPNLKTLPEAELLYGKKQVKRKKVKVPDYSDINMDLIPEHLKKLLKVDKTTNATKEAQIETNKNLGSTEANSKS